jgi:hypothetical protein
LLCPFGQPQQAASEQQTRPTIRVNSGCFDCFIGFLSFHCFLASFFMMIFFVDTCIRRPDWSSAPVRPATATQELIGEVSCVVVNCLLFNAVVFLALFLALQIHVYRQSRLMIHSPSPTPTRAMNTSSAPRFVIGLAEWMKRGMDFGLLFCLGFLVLMTYDTYLDSCRLFRDLYNFIFKVRPTIYHGNVSSGPTGHQDDGTARRGRPSTTTPHEVPRTCKTRFLIVKRRTNPLYWNDPMICLMEYGAASRLRSPGRSFVSNGRTLPTICEERAERQVHFSQVAEVYYVPRDDLDKVARGGPVPVDSTSATESMSDKLDGVGGSGTVDCCIHIPTARDDDVAVPSCDMLLPCEVPAPHQNDDDDVEDMDWEITPNTIDDSLVDEPVFTFWTGEDQGDVQQPANSHDLDEVPQGYLVDEDELVASASATESESESEIVDGSGQAQVDDDIPATSDSDHDNQEDYGDHEVISEDVSVLNARTTRRIAPVPPLRRSKRLAEIRLREQLSSCSQGHDVPELLGSVLVNGLRRSSRQLKVSVKKNVGRHRP